MNDIILSSGLCETQGTPPKGVRRPGPQPKATSPVPDGARMEETNLQELFWGPDTGGSAIGACVSSSRQPPEGPQLGG